MRNDRFHNLLHLHLIVFIWGFTAVLGKMITVSALPLVWYRMGLAALAIGAFLALAKISVRVRGGDRWWLLIGGVVVALHWVTFFWAIKVSTVSVALAMMATGAFFIALMEPFVFQRKLIAYEIVLGLVVMGALYVIFRAETQYLMGMGIALLSALLAAVFSLINGKLVQRHRPVVISFYELGIGALFLTVALFASGGRSPGLLVLQPLDMVFLLVLALGCTAYAFIASVKVMHVLSPYTVMLTTNLEPVYGILLAWLVFGESEAMDAWFYVGAMLILATVIVNGILKQRANRKQE